MMTREEINSLLNRTAGNITDADLDMVKQSMKETQDKYDELHYLYELMLKVRVLNRELRRQRNNE